MGNRHQLGKFHSQETREKLRISAKNRTDLRGVPKSDVHKQAISAAMKKRLLNEDERYRLSERMKIIQKLRPATSSDETKAKISEALKAAWSSGKRKKPQRDWKAIQSDFDSGLTRAELFSKHTQLREI